MNPRPRAAGTAAAFLAVAAALQTAVPARAGCGTALLFERANRLGLAASLKSPSKASAGIDGSLARTRVTDNFLLHYSLRGVHRARLAPEDSALSRLSDSLYAAYAGLGADARDSAVLGRLDALHAPHPAYIETMGRYLEAARAYYVGTLGMRAPVSQQLSVHYRVDPSLPRRFPVDVVDVSIADPDYAGPTYGITYPQSMGMSISFDNDFLWATTLDSAGRVRGEHITSKLDGKLLHDYAEEWELGIKVTAFHEFYHAVQFAYTPNPFSYHAWFEISATGMEERLAPEVDDYLQYLPCVLRNHATVPLTSQHSLACPTHSPEYGNAIFHQYLSKALDSSFDAKVWDRLARNGDKLQEALETVFAQYGKGMPELYSEYAAEDFFAGTRFAPPPPRTWSTGGLYSGDMPKWPGVQYDSVDLGGEPYRVITLPPLTFGVLKVKRGPGAATRTLQSDVATGITRIHAAAESSLVERLGGNVTLGSPREGFDAYYLVLPNPSFTEKATVEIRDPDADFYAFPNPVSAARGALYLSPAKDMEFPAQVRIYGEAGRLQRALEFGSGEAMTWDLRDEGGIRVKPGVYYYRLGNGPLKALVVLR